MNDLGEQFVLATEGHCLDEIRSILDAGLAPDTRVRGRSLVNWLTEMYSRSSQFSACLKLLLERGATLDDPIIAPVLLNDADGIASTVRNNPSFLQHRTNLVSAFTPLLGASLLHVAAEFGLVESARALLKAGADPNAVAAVDEFALNGHTPLFHTVNSICNYCLPIMGLLLESGARVDVRLAGITWGKGFEWETTCFDVTPISYAQMGLLPQFHRQESEIYSIIVQLLRTGNREVPPLENIPNRYLAPRR